MKYSCPTELIVWDENWMMAVALFDGSNVAIVRPVPIFTSNAALAKVEIIQILAFHSETQVS